MHYLELGGAEMALIGLLHALDPKKVAVDFFIYSHQGPLMKYIPNWVNLLPEMPAYSVIEKPMVDLVKQKQWSVLIRRLIARYKHSRYLKENAVIEPYSTSFQFVGDCVTHVLPSINPEIEYDLCISFLTPHNIGRDKVRAKKRLAWIHTDYSTISVCAKQELPVWDAYDYIASISEDVKQSFLQIFPSLSNKLIMVENILPSDYIIRRSQEFDASVELKGNIKVLSIGRLCYQKNYDNVPNICKRLVMMGIDVIWYIIGYGIDEQLIRDKIKEAGMENRVILLGKKENPYPYITACDIYVQPSRYEGKSVTVREAQILGKPVVVTAYPTAPSQINDGVDGVIVPLDNEGCATGLARFIKDSDQQNKIIDYVKSHDFSGIAWVEKIYSLLG